MRVPRRLIGIGRALVSLVLGVVAILAMLWAFYLAINVIGVLANVGALIPLAGVVGALLVVGLFVKRRRLS